MNNAVAFIVAALSIGAYAVTFKNTHDILTLKESMEIEIDILSEQVFHMQEELETLRLNQDQYMLHMCSMDDQCDVMGLAEQMAESGDESGDEA